MSSTESQKQESSTNSQQSQQLHPSGNIPIHWSNIAHNGEEENIFSVYVNALTGAKLKIQVCVLRYLVQIF